MISGVNSQHPPGLHAVQSRLTSDGSRSVCSAICHIHNRSQNGPIVPQHKRSNPQDRSHPAVRVAMARKGSCPETDYDHLQAHPMVEALPDLHRPIASMHIPSVSAVFISIASSMATTHSGQIRCPASVDSPIRRQCLPEISRRLPKTGPSVLRLSPHAQSPLSISILPGANRSSAYQPCTCRDLQHWTALVSAPFSHDELTCLRGPR